MLIDGQLVLHRSAGLLSTPNRVEAKSQSKKFINKITQKIQVLLKFYTLHEIILHETMLQNAIAEKIICHKQLHAVMTVVSY